MCIKWPVDTTPGKINWCQTRLGNTQGVGISQFALCNTAIVCWHFHTLYLKNIWEPRCDRIIMELQCTNLQEYTKSNLNFNLVFLQMRKPCVFFLTNCFNNQTYTVSHFKTYLFLCFWFPYIHYLAVMVNTDIHI